MTIPTWIIPTWNTPTWNIRPAQLEGYNMICMKVARLEKAALFFRKTEKGTFSSNPAKMVLKELWS